MKKIYLAIIFIFSLVLVSCQEVETDPGETPDEKEKSFNLDKDETYYYYVYGNLDDETMPIGGWSDLPGPNFGGVYDNPDLISDENYALVKASGINTIYGLFNNMAINQDYVMRSLDAAGNNGINYLVRDNQVTSSFDDEDYVYLERALNKYKDHIAFAGSMIVDEPGTVSFDMLGNLHKNYADILKDDSKMFYINMLPNYASNNQLVNGAGGGQIQDGTMTYERYMREYIEKVKPKAYSFDFYPYTGLEFGNMRQDYFDQLSIIREISNEYGIPYWVFIQASTWSPGHLRVPYQVEVDWQVATSILYGSKGIQYFMYYTSMEEWAESYEGGMVDKYGNKNPMYDYVKQNNEHILAIDHLLLHASHHGIMTHGSEPIPVPNSDKMDRFSILNANNISGSPALIGLFNYFGKPLYYVVNSSLTETANVTLNLDYNVTYNLFAGSDVNSKNGQTITLSIPAGQGQLIEVTGFNE